MNDSKNNGIFEISGKKAARLTNFTEFTQQLEEVVSRAVSLPPYCRWRSVSALFLYADRHKGSVKLAWSLFLDAKHCTTTSPKGKTHSFSVSQHSYILSGHSNGLLHILTMTVGVAKSRTKSTAHNLRCTDFTTKVTR